MALLKNILRPVLGSSYQATSGVPIQLEIEFDGTNQLSLIFRAPAASSIVIFDGDGTWTVVAGNDDTNVTHSSTYVAAGTYSLYIDGDYADITFLTIHSPDNIATGRIDRWGSELPTLNVLGFVNQHLEGDIANLLNDEEEINFGFNNNAGLYGDIALFAGKTIIGFAIPGTGITGDFSKVCTSYSGFALIVGAKVTFDTIVTWDGSGGNIFAWNCDWTSTMVDNCLISLANGTTVGTTIKIAGTNAARTSASDAAYAQLNAANTLEVNE